MRTLLALALVALAVAPPRHAAARGNARSPEAAGPTPPAPSLTLTITAPAPGAPWTMRIANTGSVPLKVIADARLLSLDVTPPPSATETPGTAGRRTLALRAVARAVACVLPADMRPTRDDDRTLVVPPGRAYAEKFDPRIFCFGSRAAAALVPGATVVAHLGWPVPARRGRGPVRITGPYAVAPIDGLEPAVAAAKEIVASPVIVGAPPALTPSAARAPRPLALATPAFVDAERAADVSLSVTVANTSTQAQSFLFRPQTLAFDVTGPTGVGVTDPSPTVRCVSDVEPGSNIREIFTTLAPRGRTSLGVLLRGFCPEKTFDQAGIYLVHAQLDTSNASGAAVGLHTFDGDVASDTSTALRIRREAMPFPSRRPALE